MIKRNSESGLAAVEMALILPLLVLLLFGVVEFSNAYGFQNDVRSAANAAARVAADTDGSQGTTELKALICGSLDVEELGGETVVIDFSVSLNDPGTADPAGSRGAIGRVTIQAQYPSFTGFFDGLGTININEVVDFAVINPTDVSPAWWPPSLGSFTC